MVEKIGRVFAEELGKRGKRFIIRSFGSIEQDYNSIDAGVRLLAKDFHFEIETKITPYDFSPFKPDNKFLHGVPGCTISAECDGLGEFLGAGRMPSESIEDIIRYVGYAKKCGVNRYTIRLDRWGTSVFDSYPINLYAYERAIDSENVTAEEIRNDYYGKFYKNGKLKETLCRMSEDGRDCVHKSLFVNGSVIFHQFPTKPVLHYLKAGGVFALFSNNGTDLSAKGEQWGIATERKLCGREAILREKEEAVSIAERNISALQKIKAKLNKEDRERLLRLWNYAYVEALSNSELCKVVSAYFDSMEEGDAEAVKLKTVQKNLEATLGSLQCNRPIIELSRLILSDFSIEYTMRKKLSGCMDFVIPAGIFDDIRGERYMHGASEEYMDGSVLLRIGNRIFPNAYYKTTLKGSQSGAKIFLEGKGICDVTVNGRTETVSLESSTGIDVPAADRYTVTVRKSKGSGYPLLASVSVRSVSAPDATKDGKLILSK